MDIYDPSGVDFFIVLLTGGVATLNHRLMALTPTGFACSIMLPPAVSLRLTVGYGF